MWRTPIGTRTLVGKEGQLIRSALAFMVDQLPLEDEIVELNDVWPSEVRMFDRLTLPQKYACLGDVAEALLNKERPSPELSAVREATVTVHQPPSSCVDRRA